MLGYYVNKKNGNAYFAEQVVTNATNNLDGQQMVLYYPCGKDNTPHWTRPFVREYTEFLEKFIRLGVL